MVAMSRHHQICPDGIRTAPGWRGCEWAPKDAPAAAPPVFIPENLGKSMGKAGKPRKKLGKSMGKAGPGEDLRTIRRS